MTLALAINNCQTVKPHNCFHLKGGLLYTFISCSISLLVVNYFSSRGKYEVLEVLCILVTTTYP